MQCSIIVNHRLIWLADCQRGFTDIPSSVDNGIATCEQPHGFCSESATVVQKGIKGKRQGLLTFPSTTEPIRPFSRPGC